MENKYPNIKQYIGLNNLPSDLESEGLYHFGYFFFDQMCYKAIRSNTLIELYFETEEDEVSQKISYRFKEKQ